MTTPGGYKPTPRTTLAQWRALQAVVDEGSFAAAAEALGRSQSSVSYAVSRLEELTGVKLLRLVGRRAELTEAGETLLRGARQLLAETAELEGLAGMLEAGWEAEVALAVDGILPRDVLLQALADFARESVGVRLNLEETILSGAEEAVVEGRADLAVAPEIPPGYLGEPLVDVAFVPVTHPEHPLQASAAPVSGDTLTGEIQLVIRDSAQYRRRDSGWLGSRRRWTVSSMEMARQVVAAGVGFAWLPEHMVREDLAAGRLRRLDIQEGGGKRNHLNLVFAQGHRAGPAVSLLAECLLAATREHAGSMLSSPDPGVP